MNTLSLQSHIEYKPYLHSYGETKNDKIYQNFRSIVLESDKGNRDNPFYFFENYVSKKLLYLKTIKNIILNILLYFSMTLIQIQYWVNHDRSINHFLCWLKPVIMPPEWYCCLDSLCWVFLLRNTGICLGCSISICSILFF